MKDSLSANTEVVSYFLWEYTRHSNALDLWYCAEDIGFFLEGEKIFNREQIDKILLLPKNDSAYIDFIRNIAYRVYFFTSEHDRIKNWFASEHLLQNGEWISAALAVSTMYSGIRNGNIEIAGSIRTEKFRRLFY